MRQLAVRFIILISTLSASPYAWGKDPLVSSFDLMQSDSYARYSAGNEFMSGQEPGVVMMKVNLWGAVRRPGIHHIPVKTSLIELMSYAGGPSDTAIMDSITIKRTVGQEQKKISINLSEVIHDQKVYDLVLKPDDIIVVPASQPWVSQNMFTIAMMLSILASTVLSVQLISDK